MTNLQSYTDAMTITTPTTEYNTSNANPDGINSPHNRNTTILYAVQRCWHSGPKQYQPMDYIRLFHTQRDAEEAAYHSAHAWANHLGKNTIKTLLLPSYPAHNPQGSSYGFIACGSLFWVRALKATIVTARHHNRMFMYDQNDNVCNTAAYAIVTEGVIGGTGNKNSRRGTEICENRVFGGDASSHKVAMDQLKQVQMSFQLAMQLQDPPQIQLQLVPIGKPTEYSSGSFLQDWPSQVIESSTMDIMQQHSMKRPSSEDEFWMTQEEEGMVVDCPFEKVPSAKRRRFAPTATTASGENTNENHPKNGNHNTNNNGIDSMVHGTGTGGLLVMRGGVFVGATNSGSFDSNNGGTNATPDVAMT